MPNHDLDDVNKQGGPAFPVSIPGTGDNGWHGMSLRDWFAGQAMTGMLAHGDANGAHWSALAQDAYNAADAMLALRKPK